MTNFLSLSRFKELEGIGTIEILRNKHTGKTFAGCDNGKSYKVQQDLDVTKEIKVLVEDGDLSQACIINAGRGAEVLATL